MEENKKPATTFQTYDQAANLLTVHTTDNPDSPVYFFGKPEDYDGSATEPAAPTPQYIKKHEGEGAEAISETGSAVSSDSAEKPAVEENDEKPSIEEGFVNGDGEKAHYITQEDLDNNPAFANVGLKVGDLLWIPKEAQ